jgi:hypothetical protein
MRRRLKGLSVIGRLAGLLGVGSGIGIRVTLRFEPLRQLLVKLLLGEGASRLNILKTLVDLLAHVDVVLNIVEGGVLGEKVEEAHDFFFGGVHRGDCTSHPGDPIIRHPRPRSGRNGRPAGPLGGSLAESGQDKVYVDTGAGKHVYQSVYAKQVDPPAKDIADPRLPETK